MESCFAYINGRCNVLKVKKCQGESCKFFKTQEQLAKERKAAFEHIRSLDESTRQKIVDNYYGGNMSVLEEE